MWQTPVRQDQRTGTSGYGQVQEAGEFFAPNDGEIAAGEGNLPGKKTNGP